MPNKVWDCVENLPKALVEVHLLRWIVTYPVDKVIHSLNNWRQDGRIDGITEVQCM